MKHYLPGMRVRIVDSSNVHFNGRLGTIRNIPGIETYPEVVAIDGLGGVTMFRTLQLAPACVVHGEHYRRVIA